MNTIRLKIELAIKEYVAMRPQSNLDSEACQKSLSDHIHSHLTDDLTTTLNKDQLTFFTEFDGDKHK